MMIRLKMASTTLVLILFMMTHGALCSGNTVQINSTFGKIRGLVSTTQSGQEYIKMRGIPFALPPTGTRRFQKTVEHPQFDDDFVIDATQPAVKCIRPKNLLYGEPQGSEDCLVLNIFMKNDKYIPNPSKPKKVIIFIFGGAFNNGSPEDYDLGTMVTEHDIIGVLPNYRLGVLGFLSTENSAAEGNWGLWDQIMAIKWVKKHIASLGGDPNDITVSGESAGAMSSGIHIVSPYSKDLFTKVYLQSGASSSGIRPYYTKHQLDAVELAQHFKCYDKDYTYDRDTNKTGLTLEDSRNLVQCLKSISETEIGDYLIGAVDRNKFLPRVDGDLLPDVPRKLLQDESYLTSVGFYDKQYLVVINNNERSAMNTAFTFMKAAIYASANASATDAEKEAIYMNLLATIRNLRLASALNLDPQKIPADEILNFYQTRLSPYNSEVDIVSDVAFFVPQFELLNAAASKNSRTNAWLLYFDHFPVFMKPKTPKGMWHGLDLAFWTDFIPLTELGKFMGTPLPPDLDPISANVKSMFQSIIADFVKDGNLSDAAQNFGSHGSPWPVYDVTDQSYLDFGPRPRVRTALFADKYHMWFNEVPKWVKIIQDGS